MTYTVSIVVNKDNAHLCRHSAEGETVLECKYKALRDHLFGCVELGRTGTPLRRGLGSRPLDDD